MLLVMYSVVDVIYKIQNCLSIVYQNRKVHFIQSGFLATQTNMDFNLLTHGQRLKMALSPSNAHRDIKYYYYDYLKY